MKIFVVKRLGQTILHLTSSCRRPVGTIVGGYKVRSSRSNDDVIFTTICTTSVQATGQCALSNYPGNCNMICAIRAQLNVLFHPLVIYMMKTRLDSRVAADLTVKLCNVVRIDVLFRPLVTHMMKTRLDSQVAAKLMVKLYNHECCPTVLWLSVYLGVCHS